MATKTFEEYFTSKGALPGEQIIEGDEVLVLRAGTVFSAAIASDNAIAVMQDNLLVTDIIAVDVWELINGTLVEGAHTSTFTFAANQYTFVGDNRFGEIGIQASVSLSKVSNNLRDYAVGVFINAVQVGTEMVCSSSTANGIGFALTTVTHILQTGDVIDMRVRCLTDATDCTVTSAQLNIG